ncbi:MAG: hypothetical protein K1W20_10785 [Lachnospiraceae bacterium]
MSEIKPSQASSILKDAIGTNSEDVTDIIVYAASVALETAIQALKSDSVCTCEARVICTNATEDSMPHHMKTEEGLVHMGNIEELNRTNIEPCENFEGCTKSPDGKCMIAQKYREWIADQEWKAVDETSSQGEGKEKLNKETSYMVCTEYEGVIYFYDDGQVLLSNYLYNNEWHYKATADYISSISYLTGDWDDILKEIREAYEKNKEVYEEISAANGYLPPELIAAIHYREKASDYLAGTFSVYLHNGDPLGEMSTKEPKPPFFDKEEFKAAALHALEGKEDYFNIYAKKLHLTSDSEDITAMVTFSVLYNGWNHEGKVDYAYNGTDLYTKGAYTSDHQYDPNAKPENLGTYLVLKELLNQ